MMVSLDSAQLFYPKEQLVPSNTDHSRIAKLRRGENSIYPHIRSAIRRALLGLDEERATAELSKLQISPHEGDSSPNSVFRRNSKQKQAETTYSRLPQPSNFRTLVSVVPQERLGLEETSYGNSRRAQPSSKNRLLSGERSSGATVDTADKSVAGWQNVNEIAEDTHGKPAMSSPSSRTDTETTSYGFDKQSSVSEGTLQAFPGITDAVKASLALSPVDSDIKRTCPEEARWSNSDQRTPSIAPLETEPSSTDHQVATLASKAASSDDPVPGSSREQYPTGVQRREEASSVMLPNSAETNLESADSISAKQNLNASRKTRVIQSGKLDKIIYSAIVAGEGEKFRDLILQSYDINCRDDQGQTILHVAALLRQEQVIKVAFELGADSLAIIPNGYSSAGFTTLHMISLSTKLQKPVNRSIMRTILQHKPPLEQRAHNDESPLMTAVRYGQTMVAACLIAQGANLFAKWDSLSKYKFLTLVQRATQQADPRMLGLLIASGAPLKPRSTGLCFIPPIIELLWNSGGSPDILACVKIWVEAGEDQETEDGSGRTALNLACLRNASYLVDGLLKLGANVEAPDLEGLRPLHFAAHRGSTSIIKALLSHGANPCTQHTQTFLHSRYSSNKKPSGMPLAPTLSKDEKQEVREMLKDGEKKWKKEHCSE